MIEGLKRTKRDAGKETRPITINTDSGIIEIGGKSPIIIAGPCSVESEDQIVSIARSVKKVGANLLRGGFSRNEGRWPGPIEDSQKGNGPTYSI